MNIEQNTIDELNAELIIHLEPKDYSDRFEQALKNYRKKVQLPGFRPGHVPTQLIRQRFGKSLLAEEINNVLQDAIQQYITDKKLEILGNPLPKNSDEVVGNWDEPGDFKFRYELGLAPEFALPIDKSQSFDYFRVNVDDALIDRQVKDLSRRFGKLSNPGLSEEEDMIVAELVELDENGQVKENGIKSNTTVSIEYIKDPSTRASLIGLIAGNSVDIDPNMLSENHEDLAQMLGITHHDVHHLHNKFRLTVTEIKRITPHEPNQELFDKLYGKDTISSEAEMRERVKNDITRSFEKDSDWLFRKEFTTEIVKRINPQLPDEFLKRWITLTNEKPVNPEELNYVYPSHAFQLKWQLIENKIIKDHSLKVSVPEALEFVKEQFRMQFAQYGIPADEAELDKYAKKHLGESENARRVYETLYELQIMNLVKSNCTIVEKTISHDEFVHRIQH